MSLQDIELSKLRSSSGIARTIDRGAEKLILDTLQISQYSLPIESTVRELASNAVDAQKEKEVAISILTGKTKPEDHFISREGEKYDASKWDPSYYDLKHLNTEESRVTLTYKENPGTGFADRFSVRDAGVGLGGSRLEGYFKLGYSTKRNTKEMLGAFGYGNKVALSTRCEMYIMETVHNGKKFRFNCGSHTFQSAIGPISEKDGQYISNKYITFESGDKVYYEETEEKNYTEIIVPVKRINRSRFTEAVHNQLLYFNNIDYFTIDESGYKQQHNIRATVRYASEHLLVSDNRRYSKPHIVIVKDTNKDSTTGVCYGYINFDELEMQNLFGSIGFKCPIRSVITDEETGEETLIQDGVNVTPSREQVIWDDDTKNYVTKLIGKAKEEAAELLSEELKEKDLIKWHAKAEAITSARLHGDSVVARLAKLVDTESIRPSYTLPDKTKLAYVNPTFFFSRVPIASLTVVRELDSKTRVYKDKVKRNEPSWTSFSPDSRPVLLIKKSETPVRYKMERYVKSALYPNRNVIRIDIDATEEDILKMMKAQIAEGAPIKPSHKKSVLTLWAQIVASYEKLYPKSDLLVYEDIQIDPEWEKQDEAKDNEQQEEVKKKEMSDAERRELNNLTLVHYMNPNEYNNGREMTVTDAAGQVVVRESMFTKSKLELKPVVLTEYDGMLYYGSTEDLEYLHAAACLVYGIVNNNAEYVSIQQSFDPGLRPEIPRLLFVNQKVAKFLDKAGHKHISEFFHTMDPETTEISTTPLVKTFLTQRLIRKRYDSLKFLNGFKNIHPDAYKVYREIVSYMSLAYDQTRMGYRNLNAFISDTQVANFVHNAAKIQMMEIEGASPEAIANATKELTLLDELGPLDVLDFDIIQKFSILEEFSRGLEWMSHITNIETDDAELPHNVENALADFLQLKDKHNFNFDLDD